METLTANELIKQLLELPEKIKQLDESIITKQAALDILERDIAFYKRSVFDDVRKEVEETTLKPRFKNEAEREFETDRRLRSDGNYLALITALENAKQDIELQKIAQDYNVRKNHNYRILAAFFSGTQKE